MQPRKIVIAIDGYASCGKSTMAKELARKIGYVYIDSGAMYRAVTWKLLQTGEAFSPALAGELAQRIRIVFVPEGEINRVLVDGTEVTRAIRSIEVTSLVSKVAAVPAVRDAMVAQQRRMGMEGGIVMDGRDIGTVVFPAAQCKIFLTASVEERALRRGKELAAKGEAVNYEQLRTAIARRDKEDSERAVSPLRQAEDAIYLDTTEMDITRVTEEILRLVNLAQMAH